MQEQDSTFWGQVVAIVVTALVAFRGWLFAESKLRPGKENEAVKMAVMEHRVTQLEKDIADIREMFRKISDSQHHIMKSIARIEQQVEDRRAK